jgi:hypothetical protein
VRTDKFSFKVNKNNNSIIFTMEVQVIVDAAGKDKIVELSNIHKTYLLGIEGIPALR